MDQEAAGLKRDDVREYLAPSGEWGGVMTTRADGSKSLELHQECRLQLCKENVRRLSKK